MPRSRRPMTKAEVKAAADRAEGKTPAPEPEAKATKAKSKTAKGTGKAKDKAGPAIDPRSPEKVVSERKARISVYDEGIRDRILDGLVEGKGMEEICAPEDMPSFSTVYRAQARDEELARDIARAREVGMEALIDRQRAIAQSATVADWQVAQMKVRQMQWEMAKLKPKKFGDRLLHEHEHRFEDIDEIKSRIAQLLGKAAGEPAKVIPE